MKQCLLFLSYVFNEFHFYLPSVYGKINKYIEVAYPMIKKLLKIVSILLILSLCAAGIFFYSIFISVERLNIQYETITSTKIPSDLQDVKIAFISDLEYNHFMNKERLTHMIKTINDAKPDVIIFGGDIFNLPMTYVPDENVKQEVAQLLKTIEAPLGKFAVYGEQDKIDETILDMVKDILYASDFEILENSSVKIRNGTTASISLIGLDTLVNGSIDYTQAFSNVSSDAFNIVVAHCPDTIVSEGFPSASVDLMFAGHSHSSQIYIPLLGSISSDEGAKHYNHGKHTIDNVLLHISNGLGTSTMDMRLFSPPQMLVYRLQHKEVKVPEPTPIPEEESQSEPSTDVSQEEGTSQETTPPAE